MLSGHRNHLKRFALVVSTFTLLALFPFQSMSAAAVLLLTKVTGGVDSTIPASQIYPDISGDKVVWVDNRYGENSFAIYMKDLTINQESEVAYVSSYECEPQIDGNRIVWSDIGADGSSDIFMKVIGGTTGVVVSTPGNQSHPKISGDNLIWTDYGDDYLTRRLYAKNLSTGTVTLLKENGFGSYDISGNNVVWEETYQNYGYMPSDIYIKNIVTGIESAVTTASGYQFDPHISGNTVVWKGDTNEYRAPRTIYKKDMVSGVETLVASTEFPSSSLSISGDNIVWSEFVSNPDSFESCIKSKNLTSGVVKTFGVAGSYNVGPRISGDKVVWFNTNESNPTVPFSNADILITDVGNDDPAAVTTTVNSDAGRKATPAAFCISGSKVVWSDDRTGALELYQKDIISGVESPISNNTGSQERFISDQALEGNKLTWTNGTEVWVKDIVTGSETVAASSTAYKWKSVYTGNRVFWSEFDFWGPNYDTRIYAKSDNGTPVLITSAIQAGDFSASGDKVIWKHADSSIYMKDLATGETSVIAGPGPYIIDLKISGNTVIWQDDPNLREQPSPPRYIYMKAVDVPGRPQIPIVSLPPGYWLAHLSISGDILVWSEIALRRIEVKCKSISTGAVANVASVATNDYRLGDKGAEVSNGYTAWFDNRDRGTSIYARSIDSTTLGNPAPVYRFYNFKQGVHFYTTNPEEKANLESPAGNWTFRSEGSGFDAQVMQLPSTVPVHRFYNFIQGSHFYTANQAEASNVNNNLWHTFRYEGIAYYAYPATASTGKAPVYRFYNFLQGVHFYTTNPIEKANLESSAGNWTFRYEGIAYYVPSS